MSPWSGVLRVVDMEPEDPVSEQPDGARSLSACCATLWQLADTAGMARLPEWQDALADLARAAEAAERQLSETRGRIAQLENLSVTDELTGLYNRRGLGQELDKALARARRTGETGLLLLCDLDHFKPINDTYGHAAGDRVLVAVGRVLVANTRANDACARLGGDEFAVLLTEADPVAVHPRVRSLREAVSHLIVEYRGTRVPVRASVGQAAYGPNTDAATLLRMADADLYRDKTRDLR